MPLKPLLNRTNCDGDGENPTTRPTPPKRRRVPGLSTDAAADKDIEHLLEDRDCMDEDVSMVCVAFDQDSDRAVSSLLGELAERLDDEGLGIEATDIQTTIEDHHLHHLIRLGAIVVRETESGEYLYSLQPGGVRYSLDRVVQRATHDIDYVRSAQQSARTGAPSSNVSKFELAIMLYDSGYKPIEGNLNIDTALEPSMDKILFVANFNRSRLYLESLLRVEDIFRRGCSRVFHNGHHYYYACLLALKTFENFNLLTSIVGLKNEYFKSILNGGDCDRLRVEAIVDQDDDSDEDLDLPDDSLIVVVPVPRRITRKAPVPRLIPTDLIRPMTFTFTCHHKTLQIHLDGFKHQSGRRRCWATCPWEHQDCRKYAFLHLFPEQWHAMAFILCWMRSGGAVLDKEDHMQVEPPTNADLVEVQGEMPALIIAGVPDDAADL
jgi:hypothetical protein